jgi:hypothetical protein
VASKKEK